jgi:phosphatidylserine/phosphatidylglycerophosphate/cardiolipin synthase-like enzyme
MSINNDKTKLTDVFGEFFEKGSDGGIGTRGGKSEIDAAVAAAATETEFHGIFELQNEIPVLLSDGGGRFELNFRPVDFGIYTNKNVLIKGLQNGGAIDNAVISIVETKITVRKPFSKNDEISGPLKTLTNACIAFLKEYKDADGLLTVRPGFKFDRGIITDQQAIVAVVEKKIHLASLQTKDKLPEKFEGFIVDVVPASPIDLLRYKKPYKKANDILTKVNPEFERTYLEALVPVDNSLELTELEAAKLSNAYEPPSNVHLTPFTGSLDILCHVSPEGGWKSLQPFLDSTSKHLEVAMYDFSAPGIFASLQDLLKRGASLSIVYDGNPAAGVGPKAEASKKFDKSEDTILASLRKLGKKKFADIKAWKGPSGICYNAYHIKVAVKDGKAFWLSSGNWQSSNQPNEIFDSAPNTTRNYNREWNVIIENKELSDIYQKFIEWDFERSGEKPEAELIETAALPDLYVPDEELEAARLKDIILFAPKKVSKKMKVQPILSPDNYMEFATQIIKSATESLYFQNQYIKISQTITPEFDALLDLLRDQINALDNSGIILRSMFSADDRKMLEALQERGFDMAKIKLMTNTHTKGIIADGKRILLGSHNWSNAGVQYNRDASLLIYDHEVAEYYQDIFLHDWERRTKATVAEESILIQPKPDKAALSVEGMVRLDWEEYFS